MPIDPKETPKVVSGRTSGLPQTSKEGKYTPLSLDQAGRLRAILKGAVEDGVLPADALQGVESLPVEAFQALWNSTAASWDRAQSTADNADGIAAGDAGLAGTVSRLLLWNGTGWDRANTGQDGSFQLAGKTGLLGVLSRGYLYDGAVGGWEAEEAVPALDGVSVGGFGAMAIAFEYKYNGQGMDRMRYPTKFSTGKFTALGSTALWTPAASKSFRLMRYMLTMTADAVQAAAGDLDIVFYDGLTAMPIAETRYVNTTNANVDYSTGWVDLGNGILSAAADNVLNVNLSSALTGGAFRILVCGTEE